MKILNIFPDKLDIKTNENQTILKTNVVDIDDLIGVLKKEDFQAIICDAKEHEELINKLLIKNSNFPCIAITNLKNPVFPKEMNPFHCLTTEDVEHKLFHINLSKLILNYTKKINDAKIAILSEVKNAKDYEVITKADKLLYEASWGSYIIPKRKNPLIELMDQMIQTSEEILKNLSKDQ